MRSANFKQGCAARLESTARVEELPCLEGPACDLAEAAYWKSIGADWQCLHSSYCAGGVGVEWHQYTSAGPDRWSSSFHPGGLEICINLAGQGRLVFAGESMDVAPMQVAMYAGGGRGLGGHRIPGGIHSFLTLEYSTEFLRFHLKDYKGELPGAVKLACGKEVWGNFGMACGKEVRGNFGLACGKGIQADQGRASGKGVQTDQGLASGKGVQADEGLGSGEGVQADEGLGFGEGVRGDLGLRYGEGCRGEVGLSDVAMIAGPVDPATQEFVRMLRNPPCPEAGRGVWYKAQALAFIAPLLQGSLQPVAEPLSRRDEIARGRVQKVAAILRKDLANPPTLEQLGQLTGCSPYHLSRSFSKATGLTIRQYIRKVRIEEAAAMLKSGKYNVTEAAMQVGYSSLSHFSQAFCDVMGCCPGLYPLGLSREKLLGTAPEAQARLG